MLRTIKTKYYVGKRYNEPVKVNSALDANHAVATCILHMQINHYGATSAEVYDDESGQLHAVVTRSVTGMIQITYKRDPAKYETRLAIGAIMGKQK